MSRGRMLIAAALTLSIIALMTWQMMRERQIAACLNAGQVWNGPQSRCERPRAPILERDGLRRS
jgi:hypothetical protein